MFIYSLKVSIDSDQVSAVQPTDQDKDSDMAAHIKDQGNSPESAVQENVSKSAVQPTDQDKAVVDNLKGITTKFYFIIF